MIVLGDRKRLVQVVANLLDNAAKYSPQACEIRLSLQSRAGEVLLRVADQGVGISQELRSRVFDLFVQGARSADRGQGGLGIGLALVRSLVELHGGTVACASVGAGQGSEFTVRLPPAVGGAPLQPIGSSGAAGTSPGGRRRVLIVDDNADAARMLALLLEAAGHETMVEHHPLAALQRAAETVPDVCVLDIGLPDIDGNELARRLRHLPQTAGAMLVAVTGYGQSADRRNAREAGFDHFFVKPPEPGAILALLAAGDTVER